MYEFLPAASLVSFPSSRSQPDSYLRNLHLLFHLFGKFFYYIPPGWLFLPLDSFRFSSCGKVFSNPLCEVAASPGHLVLSPFSALFARIPPNPKMFCFTWILSLAEGLHKSRDFVVSLLHFQHYTHRKLPGYICWMNEDLNQFCAPALILQWGRQAPGSIWDIRSSWPHIWPSPTPFLYSNTPYPPVLSVSH